MYVGIKETVIDRIMKRLQDIRRMNREADFVAVTHEEYDELRCDPRSRYGSGLYDDGFSFATLSKPVAMDATVKTRDFEMNPAYRGRQYDYTSPYRRVMQQGTFMGVPLFVVPREYMPA